jgi:hypothetical protein
VRDPAPDQLLSPPKSPLKAWRKVNSPESEELPASPKLDSASVALLRQSFMEGISQDERLHSMSHDQNTPLQYKNTLTYKVFKKVRSAGITFPYHIIVDLAKKMIRDGDFDDAYHIISGDLSEEKWTLEVYKIMMFLNMHRTPKNYVEAKKRLEKFNNSHIMVKQKYLLRDY